MDQVIQVEDFIDAQCIRHVHLMSNFFIALQPEFLKCGELKQELGVWHYRAEYPYRGVLDIHCEGWKKFRRFVAWSLHDYTSVKAALQDAWSEYGRLFGWRPQYAFMNKLPAGVEDGHEVGSMTLLQAEWMLEKCVAVGGRQP